MKSWLPVALAVALLAWVTAAPADDPEVPERYVTVDEVKAILNERKPLVFIDVRSKEEYDAVHIRGAVNIPLQELSTRLAAVPKQRLVVLY